MSTSPRDSTSGIPKAPPIDLREIHQSSATGTNGYAVAGLILGAVGGLTLLGLVLGPVFSIIGLNQIAGTRQKGRGMAIGGLVLTGTWLALAVLFIVSGLLAPGR